MTHEEIVNLFPSKVKVSYWDLLFANKWNSDSCYGARTLKRFLKSKGIAVKTVSWGVHDGGFVANNIRYRVSSSGKDVTDSTFKDRRYTLRLMRAYYTSNYSPL